MNTHSHIFIVHCVMVMSCKKRMLRVEVCLCFEMIVPYTTMHQYCYETSYMSFVLFAVLSSCKISIFIYLLSELYSWLGWFSSVS